MGPRAHAIASHWQAQFKQMSTGGHTELQHIPAPVLATAVVVVAATEVTPPLHTQLVLVMHIPAFGKQCCPQDSCVHAHAQTP